MLGYASVLYLKSGYYLVSAFKGQLGYFIPSVIPQLRLRRLVWGLLASCLVWLSKGSKFGVYT